MCTCHSAVFEKRRRAFLEAVEQERTPVQGAGSVAPIALGPHATIPPSDDDW